MTQNFQFLASLFIITALMISPRILRIDPIATIKAFAILMATCILKVLLFTSIKVIPPGMKEFMAIVRPSELLFVFLEDALYVLPILLLNRFNNFYLKTLKYVFWPISIVSFASGHLYQGIQGFMVSLLYVPVSYFLSIRFGLGTVMLIHVFWDILIYLVSLLILNFLIQ